MELWYPGAAKRPLGPQTEPSIGIPRILIFHTMSGYLAGTDAMFRAKGYDGTESHFGVGGSWDADLDGAIWQWQDLAHGADAQFAGNAYATSVETSDGAHDGVPWTAKQVAALVDLATWWCQQTGNPARLVAAPGEHGFGYHAQFGAWNHNGHDCPGAARVKQLKTAIIPEVARRLVTANSWTEQIVKELPALKLHDSGEHVETLQGLLAARSHPVKMTGVFDADTLKAVLAVQVWGDLKPDGVVAQKTWPVLLRVA
jgi:N-acetylmuramoyl-L-alanine amidase